MRRRLWGIAVQAEGTALQRCRERILLGVLEEDKEACVLRGSEQ